MKMYIHTAPARYDLTDAGRRPLGKIRRGLWHKQTLRLYGADGRLLLTVWPEREGACFTEGGPAVSYAPFRRHPARFALRPPKAASAGFASPWGEFTLLQGEKREFTLLQDGKEVGDIRHMLAADKELSLTLPEGDEPAVILCGLVFSIAWLMLHDDDYEIV